MKNARQCAEIITFLLARIKEFEIETNRIKNRVKIRKRFNKILQTGLRPVAILIVR